MKKNILLNLILLIGLSFLTPVAYGQISLVQGWWKAHLIIEEMDFVTADWNIIQATMENASYLYIGANNMAHLIEWDNTTQQYYLENTYTVFLLGSGLALKGPYKTDAEGTLKKNSTIIMKTQESANSAAWLKGYYTHYDCT
jgi:hypothetical protein